MWDECRTHSEQVAGAQSQVQRQSSRTPLYIAALIAFLAILVDWYLLAAVALSVWDLSLLRWLHRLEQGLYQLQQLQSAARRMLQGLSSKDQGSREKGSNAIRRACFSQYI